MTMLVAFEHADAIPVFVLAAFVLGAWAVLFSVVAARTMPRLPDAGPETMELGAEPPAVANFLVSRYTVTTSAISATVVDLAARGHFSLERIDDGDDLVRLRSDGDDASRAYERQVLELVHSKASNGTVPAHELSLGYGNAAEAWWKRFQTAVIDDARDRGLTRPRFTAAEKIWLSATLAVPFAIGGAAGEIYGAAERAAHKDMNAGSGMLIAGIVWVAALTLGARILRGWRETAQGTAAAVHWLGVRNFLRHDESFCETPPAGVAIWNRLLAFGVALGAAHGTDAALPIGPTRDDEGWSPFRGLWRPVRIRYPKRFAYGESPGRAALMSAFVLIVALAGVIWLAGIVLPSVGDLARDITNKDNAPTRSLILLFAAVVLGPLGFLVMHVVIRVVILSRALPDLGRQQTFEGYVVRVPWHYVSNDGAGEWCPRGYTAVDEGRSDVLHALRYYTPDIREGEFVRVTITPRLRHVVHMERIARVSEKK